LTDLLVHPQGAPLTGTLIVPGDKSISHRAVMLSAIAEGTSLVRGWLPAGDTVATLEAIQAMGVQVEIGRRSPGAWDLSIEGRGLHGLQPAARPLNLKNAGTGMRLLAGLLAGQRFASVLDGSEQLRRRPMRRIIDPLRQMGAQIRASDGRAPLQIEPAALSGVTYELPVASAQVKSAVLLAGLYARGDTRLREPGPARDHTERMLRAAGVPLTQEGKWIVLKDPKATTDDNTIPGDIHDLQFTIENSQLLSPFNITVPGDISSAAFPLVAAAIVPHSQVTVRGVGYNDTRTGLLRILEAMGARFDVANQDLAGGEPVADITIHFDELHSSGASGDLVVRAIDEFPIWAVAATQAAGDGELRDAAELRVKEVDRIALLAHEVRKMGGQFSERADGLTVSGPTRLNGAEVDSHGDHRLGMALAVAGLVARGSTLVRNAECIDDSFPGFVETMRSLGANMEWL
jgi:3-phosphoshikimate 1-carboxyvinyltransferase